MSYYSACVYSLPMLNVYCRSFGFSGECLGQHSGAPQEANLGDGHGLGQLCSHVLLYWPFLYILLLTVNETAEFRWNYGDPQLGACKETVQGGDHFRYWMQNGPQGNRCGF